MDDVNKTHEEVVITKYSRPTAKLVPLEEKNSKTPLFGFLIGTVITQDDIIKPIEENWDANLQ